MVKVIPML